MLAAVLTSMRSGAGSRSSQRRRSMLVAIIRARSSAVALSSSWVSSPITPSLSSPWRPWKRFIASTIGSV